MPFIFVTELVSNFDKSTLVRLPHLENRYDISFTFFVLNPVKSKDLMPEVP